jgi:2,4-dienoyl-CoA reductase-like NADH-dependent reductase (Old Yellow Enzyme family)
MRTGNVMIDERYLGASGDTTILRSQEKASAKDATIKAWRTIAECVKANGSAALMQINHPGRQSPIGAGSRSFLTKNLAPSAVPLNFGSGIFTKSLVKFLYGTPAELRTDQIQEIISYFINAAVVAQSTGFDGVEIHAAHGYLLSDFLSPKVNQRSDSWGGTPVKRALIIVQIIRGIRKALGKSFCVGVKMNSADQQNEAGLEAVLEQVSALAAEEIDFLEISGGTYEDPQVSYEVPTDQTLIKLLI